MYALLVPASSSSAACGGHLNSLLLLPSRYPSSFNSSTCRLLQHHHNRCLLGGVAKNNGSEMSLSSQLVDLEDEADKIVDGMDFGELCDEFECKSSPLVESTARQLLRDILELRQGNRALGVYAVSVNYKDPVRSFTGRDKYKRPLWITAALRNPSVSVQEMVMLSSSILRIRWTIKGMPKSSIVGAAGLLIVMRVDSEFTVNQISGQVIEHQETWDLSASSALAKTFFWGSRRLYAVVEAAKDFTEDFNTRFINDNQNLNNNSSQDIFSDPTGDPTRFFQRDNSFQQDFYQIALFLAVLYFVVQFLRATL